MKIDCDVDEGKDEDNDDNDITRQLTKLVNNTQKKSIQYWTRIILHERLCSLPKYFRTINIFQLFERSRFWGFTVLEVTTAVLLDTRRSSTSQRSGRTLRCGLEKERCNDHPFCHNTRTNGTLKSCKDTSGHHGIRSDTSSVLTSIHSIQIFHKENVRVLWVSVPVFSRVVVVRVLIFLRMLQVCILRTLVLGECQ